MAGSPADVRARDGMEAMAVVRDICHLDADDALALSEWAGRALIAATLESGRA